MRGAVLAAITTALFLAACHQEATPNKVLQITEHATARNPSPGLSSEPLLKEAARVEVKGSFPGPPFSVLARTPALQKYPCSTCHSVPLEQMKGPTGSPRRAHWGLTLQHASAAVMTCVTCHDPRGLDSLHTLQGRAVGFDHSYRVCAQCHARPAADWAGGAHGKRVGGWAPPRVVQACTQCHDPHQPRWDTRWPVVAGKTSGKPPERSH